MIDNARRLYGVHDRRQAARLELGDEQAIGTTWERAIVYVVDLPVIDDDARKQFDELFGKKAG